MTQTRKFFAGVEGNQASGAPSLLPTNPRMGAPEKAQYLLQFSEDEVEVRHSGENSNHPNHPYIAFRAEVVEPDEYAGRAVFGMFYYPPELNGDATDTEVKNATRQQAQVVGAIDAILGDGTMAEIAGDDLEEALTEVAGRLAGETFVGKIGVQKARKEDGVEIYPARNRITYFYPATTWVGDTPTY